MPRVQIDNFIIDYDEAGIGVPIIFIPGLTEFKEAFAFQFRGLQDSYHVFSYDIRRGLKRASDYTLDLLVGDLRGLLEALNLDSAVICGHSFGGLIAMQFALQYPEKTKALILVSSFPHVSEDLTDRIVGFISSGEHPLHGSIGARIKAQMGKLLGMNKAGALVMESQIAAVTEAARQSLKTSKTSITQRLHIMDKADFRAALPEILSPTLVIAGAKDREFFLSSAQTMYEGIPDSSLEVIEDAGHLCFLTRHDEFNSAVDEFLSDRLAEIS